jgi:hypothetical protein
VILSHGGVASVAEATRLAAGTALSGPAGGVAAPVALSRNGLAPNIMGFDMGGTSTDIAVAGTGNRPWPAINPSPTPASHCRAWTSSPLEPVADRLANWTGPGCLRSVRKAPVPFRVRPAMAKAATGRL